MREELLKKRNDDPFKLLGVKNEDKMTFFLLKWVFNAIKQESAKDDPSFKGQPFVSKDDLLEQLKQNPELMATLQQANSLTLQKELTKARCQKEGFLSWREFLDFFLLKSNEYTPEDEREEWWTKFDPQGKRILLQDAAQPGFIGKMVREEDMEL